MDIIKKRTFGQFKLFNEVQMLKKIIIGVASIVGVGILAYAGFVAYVLCSFLSGCGWDDGPFHAIKIEPVEISDSAMRFKLSNNGELIVENRADTLSPILILIERGEVKWTLDTDVKNTEGYETCWIKKIENVKITKRTNPIKFTFTGYWTFGAERGSMVINRKNGENSFCLSW